MKNKFALVFFIFVCSNNFVSASENDFYGTWIGSMEDHAGVYELKFTISADKFLMEAIGLFNDGESEAISGRMSIFTWSESINGDTATRNDFRNGYVLRLIRENNSVTSVQIYMSNDKNQIIIFGIIDDEIICKRQRM